MSDIKIKFQDIINKKQLLMIDLYLNQNSEMQCASQKCQRSLSDLLTEVSAANHRLCILSCKIPKS